MRRNQPSRRYFKINFRIYSQSPAIVNTQKITYNRYMLPAQSRN
nr:MAG TPA: hypothetical protein [Caudoviricetes sp.]